MIDFDLGIKTKIYFGPGKEKLVGSILKENNAHRVLIVIGQGSVKKSGLLDIATDSIKEQNIEYLVVEGVRPNPTISFVHDALSQAKEFKPDFVLAIGGGSAIDAAKLIAADYYYNGDLFDFNMHKVKPEKALPVGVILTISASGSEMSTSCVIQNDETKIKKGFNSELIRPVFAIENPELTYSVSPYKAGSSIAARMAMIAITTRSSIKVKILHLLPAAHIIGCFLHPHLSEPFSFLFILRDLLCCFLNISEVQTMPFSDGGTRPRSLCC